MSRKPPNLATNYENNDPDHQSASSSLQNLETRNQPDRKAKRPQLDKQNSFVHSISDDDDTQYEILTNTTSIHSQMAPPTVDNEAAEKLRIQQIVSEMMKSHPRQSPPKVDIPKLSMKNYVDWSKKMRYALQLNNLWVDPTLSPTTLTGDDEYNNKKAALFMAIHLDDQNSGLVNEQNDKCFITAWNDIKRFHQPRSATTLSDIYNKIMTTQHRAGQSIEEHLMKLETQFARFHEIGKAVNEEHLVAIILATVTNSPDFASVFHSAMWEDETSTLTIAKVKSVLISTQKRRPTANDEQAHQTKQFHPRANTYKPSHQINLPASSHNRQPKDPIRGWRCPSCEMDNHTKQQCTWGVASAKKFHKQQQPSTSKPKQANQADEEIPVNFEVQAYATRCSTNSPNQSVIKRVNNLLPSSSKSIRSRLGERSSPYSNILPTRTIAAEQNHSQDILDINYEFNDSNNNDLSELDSDEEDSLLKSPPGTTNIKSHCNSNPYSNLPQVTTRNINKHRSKSSQHELNHQRNRELSPALSQRHNCMNFTVNCVNQINLNKNNLNSTTESVWIVDSGATLHITHSLQLLSNFSSHSGHNVIISDGSKIPIKGYGTIKFLIKDKLSNSSHTIFLDRVAYVPNFSVNLISVRALTSTKISLKFTNQRCYIINSNSTIPIATVVNSSYVLKVKHIKPNLNFSAMSCIHEWHNKLGHRNIAHIEKIKNALQLKITSCNCSSDCEACLKGKIHALPYPQKSDKPPNPRDIITTDVCGQFATQSLGGAKYFVTFTCAATDYTEVAAIKHKSDCKTELMNYINRCKTQFGTYPKIIRSDRGGEYLDTELQTFLNANGIIFQCSVPRCPQQNGISERKNRTLLEAIRTMLISKQLPKFLWAEALHHANNTFNAIPKEPNLPSPKEIFFNRPNKHEFIEFGIPIFYLTNPQNRSKLDERGASGIFLGSDHNSKGYRIFGDGKLRIERHVRFLKSPPTKPDFTEISNVDNDYAQFQPTQSSNTDTLIDEPMPRRSERIRAQQAHATSNPTEPKTYKQALKCPDNVQWILAMEEELKSIEDNNTWSVVDLPKGRTAIGCRWVYKLKQSENEEPPRYKARLVAQGFTQKFGIDYDEVFAPVTRSSTFRTLLTIASARNLIVQQYDVKTAFLNGSLEEEIYMKPPPGYLDSNKVLKLHKSLYGLKQAARVWNQTLNKSMTNQGFRQSKYDECLYVLNNQSDVCYAIVHVDDMIFASNTTDLISTKITELNKTFELKYLGSVRNYLGIQISRDEQGIFAICQTQYIEKIATEFQLENSKGSKFPIDPGYHKLDDKNLLDTNNVYRKLIGMLLYVSTNTRPDISAAVGILAQRVSLPRNLDLTEALRIVRYLLSTKEEKLHMFDPKELIPLVAFADSDWAEDRTTRKSISGVICKIFGGPVSWSSRKQDIVSTSTTEAEFYALSEAVKEIQWLKNILSDFGVAAIEPITTHSDNQSTIKMIENSKFSSRTKHIDVRLHFVRDCVYQQKIKLNYCPSEENVADLLTKPLAGVKMQYLRRLASLR